MATQAIVNALFADIGQSDLGLFFWFLGDAYTNNTLLWKIQMQVAAVS